jgi:hypothetical protein
VALGRPAEDDNGLGHDNRIVSSRSGRDRGTQASSVRTGPGANNPAVAGARGAATAVPAPPTEAVRSPLITEIGGRLVDAKAAAALPTEAQNPPGERRVLQ